MCTSLFFSLLTFLKYFLHILFPQIRTPPSIKRKKKIISQPFFPNEGTIGTFINDAAIAWVTLST